MSHKNVTTLTRLFILQEASRLEEALFEWRCICSERYGDRPTGADAVHAGVETRAQQTLRHDAVVGECGRRLGWVMLPSVVPMAPSDAIHAEVVS